MQHSKTASREHKYILTLTANLISAGALQQ